MDKMQSSSLNPKRFTHKLLFALLFVLVFLFYISPTFAKYNNIKLLAVSEAETELEVSKGSVADLYLEIKPGEGSVYLDTFPLTRMDTQISTRFAKEFACRELDYNCNNKNFFYTIRSGSALVGGPSAGAAITVLTIATLQRWDINKETAITGTINSGGLIGPVGGLKQKIDAASENGIKTILIPNGERFFENKQSNITTDLLEYAKSKNITLVEVNDVKDAVYYFTLKNLSRPSGNLTINLQYAKTMKVLAGQLCDRNYELKKQIYTINSSALNKTEIELIANTTQKAKSYILDGEYYTAASICFSANTKYSYLLLSLQNLSLTQLKSKLLAEKSNLKLLTEKIDSKPHLTITDLETYMIVKERLGESNEYFKAAEKEFLKNNTQNKTTNTSFIDKKIIVFNLAYGIERMKSAESWSSFFNLESKKHKISKEQLKNSCIQKIAEAEERYQYVKLFLPNSLTETRKTLDRAYFEMNAANFESCLFTASMSKAEADLVLSTLGTEESKINDTVLRKLEAVRINILEQQSSGFFPLAGYSYYEYAKSLQNTDKFSSLLYAEYSLELSNVDLYFMQEKRELFDFSLFNWEQVWIFLLGLSIGILITLQFFKGKLKKISNKKNYPKKKKVKGI